MKTYKKIICSILVAVMLCIICTTSVSCSNKALFDTKYTFKYAYVVWPDGTAEKLGVDTWHDFEDGDQIQITTTDGDTYVFHTSNCVLATH